MTVHFASPRISSLNLPCRPQISDSLKHFGLSPSTRHLLLVHVGPLSEDRPGAGRTEAEEVQRRTEAIVEGEAISLEDLGRLPDGGTDEKAIRKVSILANGLPAGESETFQS